VSIPALKGRHTFIRVLWLVPKKGINMLLSWWRRFFGRKSGGSHALRRLTDHPRWKKVKLYAEVLEDRVTPTTFVWTGNAGDSNWDSLANWTPTVGFGTYPGAGAAGDIVQFTGIPAQITVTLDLAISTLAEIDFGTASNMTLNNTGGNVLPLTGILDVGNAFTNTGLDNISAPLTGTVTTTVSGGTLQLSNGGKNFAGGSAFTANTNGTLSIDNDGELGNTGNPITLNGGTLQTTGTFATGRTVTLGASGGTIDVTAGNTLTASGQLTGTGGLTKSDSGTLILSNATNNYGGSTSVTGGTLADAMVANAVPTGTALSVSTGATFDLGGFNQQVASVTGFGTVTDSGGAATFTVNNGGADTFAGLLSGSNLSLIKSNTGTLTLQTANTYGGSTSVLNGTLQDGANNALPVGTSLTLGDGVANTSGVFDLNGKTQTVAGLFTAGTGAANNVFNSSGTAGALTVNVASGTDTFSGLLGSGGGNFDVTKSGAGTLTLSSSPSVSVKGVTISTGVLNAPNSGSTFNVAGNWANSAGSGGFGAGTGTVTFTAASGTQTLNSGGASFNNVSHTGAGNLQLVANSLSVGGTLTNAGGAGNLDPSTNSLGVTVTGLTTMGGGTYLAGSATQNLNGGLLLNGGNFTGSTGIVNVGSVQMTTGTLTAPSTTMNVTGNWSRDTGVPTFINNGGTVVFNGTSAQSINNVQSDFAKLTIANAAGVTQNAPASATNFTVNSGAVFNAGGDLFINSGGTFTNNGTFNANTGRVLFSGTGTVSGTVSFNIAIVRGAVDFGATSTIANQLLIDTGGSVNTNAPTYGTTSKLSYSTGGGVHGGHRMDPSGNERRRRTAGRGSHSHRHCGQLWQLRPGPNGARQPDHRHRPLLDPVHRHARGPQRGQQFHHQQRRLLHRQRSHRDVQRHERHAEPGQRQPVIRRYQAHGSQHPAAAHQQPDGQRHPHQLRRHLRHQHAQRRRRHPVAARRQHHRHHRRLDEYEQH
jgi:autotransporter-associated beta strand protein